MLCTIREHAPSELFKIITHTYGSRLHLRASHREVWVPVVCGYALPSMDTTMGRPPSEDSQATLQPHTVAQAKLQPHTVAQAKLQPHTVAALSVVHPSDCCPPANEVRIWY